MRFRISCHILLYVILISYLSAYGYAINIKGRVVSSQGSGIKGVLALLSQNGKGSITDDNGNFVITDTSSLIEFNGNSPHNKQTIRVSCSPGANFISFDIIEGNQPVLLRIVDLKGKIIGKEFESILKKGVTRINPFAACNTRAGSGLYIISVRISKNLYSVKSFYQNNGVAGSFNRDAPGDEGERKSYFSTDVLVLSKDGYEAIQMPLGNLQTDVGTLKLYLKPDCKITSPVSGAQFNFGDSLKIAAEATGNDGNISSVRFLVDAEQECADSTAPYEFYWQSLRNTIGERVVKAVATDKNGSTKTDSVKIQINSTQVRTFGYTVIKKYPHDTKDFTEGFIYDRGDTIYEGTGMTNKSWVKRYDLTTGKVYNTVSLASQYFGEGIAIHGDSIVEITYTSKVGFVYDKNTFKQIGTFSYTNSEGWGMTHDNLKYIMSDGTSKLTFWEFGTLKVLGSISVKNGTSSQNSINELEFFYNKIFANIYPSDQIVMIDLASAKVIGSVTLPKSELQPGSSADALNGIMYDKATDRIFVTGKYFLNTYEVKFFPKN